MGCQLEAETLGAGRGKPGPREFNRQKGLSEMSYEYQDEKPGILTDDGQRLFLKVRDQVHEMLKCSGAVMMENATRLPPGVGCSCNWRLMACVDRLVEIDEIVEVNRGECAGQYRLFVRAKGWKRS